MRRFPLSYDSFLALLAGIRKRHDCCWTAQEPLTHDRLSHCLSTHTTRATVDTRAMRVRVPMEAQRSRTCSTPALVCESELLGRGRSR